MKRFKNYITLVIALISFFSFARAAFAWRLFDLLSYEKQSKKAAAVKGEFDPEKDIQFLPPLRGKSFFEAVNDLSICRDPEVRKFIYVYLTRGREYTIRAIERSMLYRGTVEEIIGGDPGIPPDISLLPLLESGYNPRAVSRSKAVGAWQFLGRTSRILGLRTDRFIDERRDPAKSTTAAVRHLKNLNSIFNSWELTLAAYNGGAGYVKRAMLRTRKTSLLELKRSGALRRETSEYVSRYAALMVIYKNRDLFGIAEDIGKLEPPVTETLELEYPVDIRSVAEKAGIALETIQRLNPELSTNLTPPDIKGYGLRLPADAVRRLEPDKESLYAFKCTTVKRHIVRRGESLQKIAQRYKASPETIILLNDIQNPKRLRPGRELYIPI